MPIHLPPISRRNFLKRSITAGAGLLLAPSLPAARKPTDPHTWAMLSDTHIAADPEQLGRGFNMTDHMKQACGEVLALEKAPAGVIIPGDCAFSTGQTGDYQQFLKLLQPLRQGGLPIHIALGNHDHRERFHRATGLTTPAAVDDKYVSIVKSERANFFILDTLNEIPSNPGLLGEEQLQWLAQNLDANPEKPAMIVVHHNKDRMLDSGQLIAVMDERRHVKAMFHGHIHRWRLDKTPGGVHLINLLPVSYPSRQMVESGACGWVQAAFARDGVRLKVKCIDPDHPLHHSVHEFEWRAG